MVSHSATPDISDFTTLWFSNNSGCVCISFHIIYSLNEKIPIEISSRTSQPSMLIIACLMIANIFFTSRPYSSSGGCSKLDISILNSCLNNSISVMLTTGSASRFFIFTPSFTDVYIISTGTRIIGER